ncbi:Pisatin demethylase [Podospora fimiseda]|uniref:Pisatin demethylase n=1 Tax=Podospora fimiseda TaxID=252190 RepID=A0AAN7BFM7_9PEZI|nr:Pisatin demethylase [Podospora fimiseda]
MSTTDRKKKLERSHKFFTFTAFDIVGEILFSQQFSFLEQGKDVGNAVANSLALNAYAAVAGFFLIIHRKLIANPVITWLNILPYDPQRVKLRNVYAIATRAVGAESDTVSTGMQSFVYHMIRRKGAWDKSREEIMSSQPEEGRCKDKVVSFGDAQKLPYLQVCLKEALRVFSPVPMTLPRVAGKEGVIWGKDAKEFRPERWLGENEGFGQWYQSCPGRHVARIEMSKLAATLVRDYDIQQVDPEKNWEWKAYFTVVPEKWPVYIKSRAT